MKFKPQIKNSNFKEITIITKVNIKDLQGYASFISEYKFFDCKLEYPGWTGIENYAIITDKTIEELEDKYPILIKNMKPILILKPSLSEPITDYHRNDDKHAKRAIKNNSIFEMDEESEAKHHELATPDFTEELVEAEIERENRIKAIIACNSILNNFPDTIKKRLVLKHSLGYTAKKIAEMDGCSPQAVTKSLRLAEKKISQISGNGLFFPTLNSIHNEEVVSVVKNIISSINNN